MTPAEKLEKFEERAAELRRLVKQHRALLSGQGVPDDLKEALLAFSTDALAAGMPRTRIAELLHINRGKLRTWHRQARAAELISDLVPLPVLLAPAEPRTPSDRSAPCSSLTLVSPGGWRIEGLALPDLLALLQTLP